MLRTRRREAGRSETGSISAVVLGMLLFVSLLFIGASVFLELSMSSLRRAQDRDRERKLLVQEADRVVRLLLEDPTPFTDSPLDPVRSVAPQARTPGLEVALRDVSSRLGLNWVRKEILEELDVLRPGRTPQELQQWREDTGLRADLVRAFGDFMEEERIEKLFTAYTFFNINIGDEFALRKLFLLRTGDPQEAEALHARLQQARIEGKVIQPEGLRDFLGRDFDLLAPVVNAEPAMNVHFVPEEVLRALFDHFKVPAERAGQILALRPAAEWSEGQLGELIGPRYRGTLLHQYLGTRTWFWRIDVSSERAGLTRIVARIARREDPQTTELRLVEEVYAP